MRIVRPDRMLVVALSEAAEIGRAIMADGFERQFSEALLNFAALDLEQARFRSRSLASIGASEAAQFGKFERGQIDLELGELALEEGVGDQRLVAVEFGTGDVLHLLDPALRRRDPGNAGAFVREQEFGAGPTLILFVNALRYGHANILEPHFVDLMLAAQCDDRANGDPRRLDRKSTRLNSSH